MDSKNNNQIIKSKWFTELKAKCDGRHNQCSSFANYFMDFTNPKNNELNQELFNKYLEYMNANYSSYNKCVSTNNNSYQIILSFIVHASEKYIFQTKFFSLILNNMNDDSILKLIQNQLELDSNYIIKMINENNISANYYYGSNIVGNLIHNSTNKIKTVKYILEKLIPNEFIKFIIKNKNSINSSNEVLIGNYIKNNSEYFIQNSNKCIELINNLPYKGPIIRELFKIISENSNLDLKNELLNKSIINLDKSLIITIFESCKNNEIIPNEKMIDLILTKAYIGNIGRISNNNNISDIIDIFIMYGLKVTKSLIIKLLNKTCHINKIEKYNIPIDEDILYECSNHSYYPYKFNIKPPISVLIKECSKPDNLETIKKLKEYGGEYNIQCLVEACKHTKNGKVIKYLINECNVKSNDLCITTFQETYKIEALDYIIKGFDSNKNNEIKKNNTTIQLDKNSTVIIQPKEIKFDINDKSLDLKLKVKIKKFFDYKKKTIKYIEAYELLLKYLINNKLVIGNYFILNINLSSLLKLEPCTIMHIDQIHNILSYFIDTDEISS